MGQMTLMGVGNPSAPPLWLDHFTDTNGTLIPPHTPDIGGAYTALQGSVEVLSNEATGQTAGTHNIVTGDVGQADVTLTGTVTLDSTASVATVGFVARLSSGTAFITAYFDMQGNALDIFDNGTTFTSLASGTFAFSTGTPYALKAVFSGSAVTMYVDGTQVLQATGVTQNQTVTAHGFDLYGNSQTLHLDDFQISHP